MTDLVPKDVPNKLRPALAAAGNAALYTFAGILLLGIVTRPIAMMLSPAVLLVPGGVYVIKRMRDDDKESKP